MNFYSTKHKSPEVNLEQAVMQGLPADNGLYMPDTIGSLPTSFWKNIGQLSFAELSFELARCLLNGTISDTDLQGIVERAINFPAPVMPLSPQLYCLELFHGPSSAFKDFGARFMAQMMGHFVRHSGQKLTILVATSGDTGGAVAQGFLGTPGIEVIILYPSKKISEIQEKQLTTLGQNVQALEIDGTFDDCQRLVKTAFLDESLRSKMRLSSANSINLARLIPQSFYYANAYKQVQHLGKPIVFSVPSGNFGNLTAGLLAKRMGMPVERFIAANNANDVFTTYIKTATFSPRSSVTTLSNAMDVGNPSNLQRIEDLYQNDISAIRRDIAAYSFTDEQTTFALQQAYQQYGYVMCPHTAVGYTALKQYQNNHPNSDHIGIFLGTAHPAKFLDIVEPVLDIQVAIPANIQLLMNRTKQATMLSTDYNDLKAFLLKQ